jgi:hypothetical protein
MRHCGRVDLDGVQFLIILIFSENPLVTRINFRLKLGRRWRPALPHHLHVFVVCVLTGAKKVLSYALRLLQKH